MPFYAINKDLLLCVFVVDMRLLPAQVVKHTFYGLTSADWHRIHTWNLSKLLILIFPLYSSSSPYSRSSLSLSEFINQSVYVWMKCATSLQKAEMIDFLHFKYLTTTLMWTLSWLYSWHLALRRIGDFERLLWPFRANDRAINSNC